MKKTRKSRLYHTRYLEGYADGIQTFHDIFEHVMNYYEYDDFADANTYTQAIQMLVDKHLKIVERIKSSIN